MSCRHWLAVATVVLVSIVPGAARQNTPRPWPPQGLLPINETSPVLSARDEMATFVMAPGYRVELVAEEPLVVDPIAMDWDLEGRLWVIEMPGYMPDMLATGELQPVGRVVVLDDTNNDGRMDTRTVFLDNLVLARSIKVLEHGVLVGEPPDLWLVKDTNGDLKADTKERVTNLYGRREANVEHNANGLFWAIDNWMYTSEVDMDLRFTGAGFEVRRTLSRGQWGVTQDDAGRIFRNTNESVLHVDYVPARYYTRHSTLVRTRGLYESLAGDAREANRVWPVRPTRGVNRGYQAGVLKADGSLANFTSVSAPTIYRGDRLPADAYGNVFVVEPAGNLVARLALEDTGTTLRARKFYEGGELLASTDERFRPVNLSAAPDGALYLVDMYRGIIQHKFYITEYLRDQILARKLEAPTGYGRIYRIVHDTTVRGPRPRLTGARSSDLVALLSHPNGWWRDTAQRLIVERQDKTVVPALASLARNGKDWRARLHALWTLHGLNAITPAQVLYALGPAPGAAGDPSKEIRLSAVRLAERFLATHAGVRARVVGMVGDTDWAVRRQLTATLGELDATTRLAPLATMLERYGEDPIVVDAAVSGLRGQETAMLARLLKASTTESVALSSSITMLAATVVRGADDLRVKAVFDWSADGTRPEWQRAALVRGAEVALLNAPAPAPRPAVTAAAPATPPPCATCPGGRAGPGGASAFNAPAAPSAPTTRPRGPALRLAHEPALTAVAPADPLAARTAALLAVIEWPGKPGAARPLTPLTPAETARFNAGREVYTTVCAACHQDDGRGRVGMAPSLVGSEIALGPADVTARVLLNGKEGQTGLMPPLGAALSDAQVAGVLTYIRRAWGQDGSPVDVPAVAATRQATAGRARPWTADELSALLPRQEGPR